MSRWHMLARTALRLWNDRGSGDRGRLRIAVWGRRFWYPGRVKHIAVFMLLWVACGQDEPGPPEEPTEQGKGGSSGSGTASPSSCEGNRPETGVCAPHWPDSCPGGDCLVLRCLPSRVMCWGGKWSSTKDCTGEQCVPFATPGYCGGQMNRTCPEGQECVKGSPSSNALGVCKSF